MKRVLALIIFGGLLFFIINQALAATLFPKFSKSKDVVVSAQVGSTTLTISGYQSPFASIILKTQNGTFLASTTADSKGYFSISNVLINSANLVYCFQAVDFKRVGISEACITIPGPIVGDVTYDKVFLPPTIALSKKQISVGDDAIIFGYSMPNATVYLNIEGKVVTIQADAYGYYSYTYTKVPEGVFRISATAELAGESSLAPINDVVLESLSITQKIGKGAGNLLTGVKKKVPFELWPLILLALAFLVAIGILLYKLKFRLWVIFIDFLRRKKKMHHDWFLDRW